MSRPNFAAMELDAVSVIGLDGQPDVTVTVPAVLRLPGCVLYADPATTGRLLRLHVTDAEAAAEVLNVLTPAGSGGGEGASALWRLALVEWLATFSPVPWDDELLLADRLTAAADVWRAGVDIAEVADVAATRAAARVELVARRARAGTLPQAVRPAVLEVLHAAADWLDITSAASVSVTDALDAFAGTGAQVAATGMGSNFASLLLPGAAAAAHLGSVAGQQTRVYSVDWQQVPAGVLDPAEGTISAGLNLDAGRLTVHVLAAGRAARSRSLRFRLVHHEAAAGHHRVIADSELTLEAAHGRYTGSVPVPPGTELTDTHRVDVYDITSPRPPQLGADAVWAEGQRAAARGLVHGRLADAGLGNPLHLQARADWRAAATITRDQPAVHAACVAAAARHSTALGRAGAAHIAVQALRDLPAPPQPVGNPAAGRPLLVELAYAHPGLAA